MNERSHILWNSFDKTLYLKTVLKLKIFVRLHQYLFRNFQDKNL